MKMTIKLKGGLGNQMFQYAHGRKLELSGQKVVFDISFFAGSRANNDISRDFKLDVFNLGTNAEFLNKPSSFSIFIAKVKKVLGVKVEEYYQGVKYFIDISDIIKKEFTLKNGLSEVMRDFEEKVSDSNSISLHIRRGDYIADARTNAFHGVCGLDYYQAAMKLIKERVSAPIFFVFSDDIDWAKENLKGGEFVFVSCSSVKDYEELILMSKCKHNIVANSSFSWWGAWLNNNSEKIVIAPRKWFADEISNTDNDIVSSEWIKI